MTTAQKTTARKDLRKPDEFFEATGTAFDWIKKNQRAVEYGAVAVVAVCLLVGGIRWYLTSAADRAARDFYAAEQLFKREQWDAAREAFAGVAKDLGNSAYGRMATLYAGHAALRNDHAAEAATFYKKYLEDTPAGEASRQIAELGLAKALETTGDIDGARQHLVAADRDGAGRSDAVLGLARLEGKGNKEKAIDLYLRFLKDFPESPLREIARYELEGLGGTPPPEAMPPVPNPGNFSIGAQ